LLESVLAALPRRIPGLPRTQLRQPARTKFADTHVFETAAPAAANLVLLLEMAMGGGLLVAAWLARKGRFRLHAWCRSAIVLLNLAVIAVMMIPSFHVHVFPRIPAKFGRAYFTLATVHAVLKGITETAGLYFLLAAGDCLLPANFRITKLGDRCEALSCSGGLCCCWEWRPTRAGRASIYFRNEFVD
jgi:hypothetical protein